MTDEEKAEVRKIVKQEIEKWIPEWFGRSLVQLKRFFTSTIT